MIIDTEYIDDILKEKRPPSEADVNNIFKKALRFEILSLQEAASLLLIEDQRLLDQLYKAAAEIKRKVFGRRIVLFAPLYLSNYCINNCLYCGFRKDNRAAKRRTLSIGEVVREAVALEEMGFNRVLLVTGEDPKVSGIDYIIRAVEAIYKRSGIRIVHVNAAPMEVEELRLLKKAGVGVYQVFQETYHRPTYERMHPSGKKRDYEYRLGVMDRAMRAGFGDVGIGALLGLHDYRFDVLATIAHSGSLYKRYGTHAHTISVPRLRPAAGSVLKDRSFQVSDKDFKKIVAVYRLAVPSAGIVVSTREGARLRDEVIHNGASQISAGSMTEPGGYAISGGSRNRAVEQFSTNDHRTITEVIASIAKSGLIPSLCTTCYRVGRTGREFTEKTMDGNMEKFCNANAILTLKEFILDHGQNGIRELCNTAIERGLMDINDRRIRMEVIKRLKAIREGKRDVYL